MVKVKRNIGCLLGVIFVMTISLLIPVHKVFAAPHTFRLSGQDRYKTSLAILKHGWDTAKSVVVVNGENFPDGLSAAPLAKKLNAPIILTKSDGLDTEILDRIKELNPGKVYIIGGEGVISKSLEDVFKNSLNADVIRLLGKNRYETSINIANYMYSNFNMGKEIAVAYGENFPDALSMAPIAAIKGMPIILTTKSDMNKDIETFINEKQITKSYIIGGAGVISDELANKFPGKDRIWGKDRYETNSNIMNLFMPDLSEFSIFVASGANFPDALGGAAIVARFGAPIFLTAPQPEKITQRAFYSSYEPNPENKTIYVLGGSGVVPEDTIQKLTTKERVTGNKVTIGMTLDDVLKIMGNPTGIDPYRTDGSTYYFKGTPNSLTWSTRIDFMKDKALNSLTVVGWSKGDEINISSKINIGEKQINSAPITIGSDIRDIAAAIGTPYAVSYYIDYSIWRYPNESCLYVDPYNQVMGWINNGNLKIDMGKKDPSAPGITKGSYIDDVVRAMGSTDQFNLGIYFERSMKYGNSYVGIDKNGRVIGWVNNGDLKLAP